MTDTPTDTSPTAEDLCMTAWGIIANVSEGDWTQQTPGWRAAALRWRDQWHDTLPNFAPDLLDADGRPTDDCSHRVRL